MILFFFTKALALLGPSDFLPAFSIAAAVALHGAVVVVISVLPDLLSYTGGIYDNPACTPTLQHAVTVVGYGTDAATGTDYWLVKNSFGRAWGDEGFFRIVRGKNMCGIEQFGWVPIVKK